MISYWKTNSEPISKKICVYLVSNKKNPGKSHLASFCKIFWSSYLCHLILSSTSSNFEPQIALKIRLELSRIFLHLYIFCSKICNLCQMRFFLSDSLQCNSNYVYNGVDTFLQQQPTHCTFFTIQNEFKTFLKLHFDLC